MYVKDAARCLILLSKVEKTGTRVYNTRGEVLRVGKCVEIVKKFLPEAKITLEGGNFPIEKAWKYDTSQIQKEVGFYTEYTMEQGIKETL